MELQISYIKEYINHRDDLMLLDVFADKRCTGTNFDRPEFEQLLKALQEWKVNCIVVKDFSRLGRNFVETGQYLEQVFPLFGVRFIAINDNYDSLNRQSRDGMLVPIKSMINEMYSKDLSKKIQSCFRSKEARGEIYTPVPFGYKRNQQNHLILDEEVSDVVEVLLTADNLQQYVKKIEVDVVRFGRSNHVHTEATGIYGPAYWRNEEKTDKVLPGCL